MKKLVLLLTLLTSVFYGCDPKILPSGGFGGEYSSQLTEDLFVHKTSATTYTLCDAEGFGLIDGKLVGLLLDKKAGAIHVAFIPFGMPLDDVGRFDISQARIVWAKLDDLKAREAQAWVDVGEPEKAKIARKLIRMDALPR